MKKLSTRKQFLLDKFGEGLPDTISLPAINSCWRINYIQQPGRKGWEHAAFDGLNIYGSADKALRNLESWLTTVAREHLQTQMQLLENETGLVCERMQIRAQKSRWGSCSSRGTISLNRNVLFFTPEVVRYLLVHELCHTKHMNHSKKYWALVEKYCPDYQSSDKLLSEAWRFLPPWSTHKFTTN